MSINNTVSLSKLRAADDEAMKITMMSLKRDGFVFLDMSDDVLGLEAVPVVEAASKFLQGPGRGTGSKVALSGHISTTHKDSISLLSGNQFDDDKASSLPISNVGGLVRCLDKAAIDVVSVLARPLFGCSSMAEFARKYDDLPLLNPTLDRSYGMVDIVRYHNDPGCPEYVVSEHQDPGLLVISLPQLSDGLELLNSKGQWVAPPRDVGVLWAGSKATQHDTGVAPGIHRVRSVVGSPRVSCWHEICTSRQISSAMLAKLKEERLELEMGTINGTDEVIDVLRRAESHDPSAIKLLKVKEISPRGGIPILKVEHATFRVAVGTVRPKKVGGLAGVLHRFIVGKKR